MPFSWEKILTSLISLIFPIFRIFCIFWILYSSLFSHREKFVRNINIRNVPHIFFLIFIILKIFLKFKTIDIKELFPRTIKWLKTIQTYKLFSGYKFKMKHQMKKWFFIFMFVQMKMLREKSKTLKRENVNKRRKFKPIPQCTLLNIL